jgi:O-antigen biosynthesis protein
MAAVQETRRQELEAIAGVHLTLTYSEVERAVIDSETLGRASTALCPWVEEVRQAAAPLASRSGITFLGSYQHPPNRDAVEGFLATVWPQLLERVPDLQFHLYGSGISDELLRSWRTVPGVQVHGWVRSVAEVYERHRVFVAPLRAGAGIKGKVIAGLAHGIPQVLSPVAAEATGVRHGLEAFIASTPEAWCAAVGDLLVNDELWTRTSEAALAHARQHYSRERGLELMATALSSIDLPVSR